MDQNQAVTISVSLDLTNISEAERRVRAVRDAAKEIENLGAGNSPQAVSQTVSASNRRAQALNTETAAIDRNTQAQQRNAAARARATNTGMMHGPQNFVMTGGNPAIWGGAVSPSYSPEFTMPGHPGSLHPLLNTRQAQLDALRANIQARFLPAGVSPALPPPYTVPRGPNHSGLLLGGGPAVVTGGGGLGSVFGYTPRNPYDALGQPAYRTGGASLVPLAGGRAGFNGMSTYGRASAAALATRGSFFQGSQLPNALQTIMAGSLAFDPNLSMDSRLTSAGYAMSNLHYTAQAGGRVGAAAGFLGRVSMAALPAYLALEGTRSYYQGEADYQAQIGAGLDSRLARMNLRSNYRGAVADANLAYRQQRSNILSEYGNAQFANYTAGRSRAYSFDEQRAATYSDIGSRVRFQQETLGKRRTEMGQIDREIDRLQRGMVGASPEEKESLQRQLAGQLQRKQNVAGAAAGMVGSVADTVAGAIEYRDSLKQQMDEFGPMDLSSARRREAFNKVRSEYERITGVITDAGAEGMSAASVRERGGRTLRGLIDAQESAASGRASASLNSELAKALEEASKGQVDVLKEIRDLLAKQMRDVPDPPEAKREGVSGVVESVRESGTGGIGMALGTIMQYMNAGE